MVLQHFHLRLYLQIGGQKPQGNYFYFYNSYDQIYMYISGTGPGSYV